jgi:hypothetical protein
VNATASTPPAALAGIAASDVACALAVGMVSAGAHDHVVMLLAGVSRSRRAIGDLSQLLALKTTAHHTGKSMAEP